MTDRIRYNTELDYLFSLYRYFKKKKPEDTTDDKSSIWDQHLNKPEMMFVKSDLSLFFSSLPFIWFFCEFVERYSLEDINKIHPTEYFSFMNEYVSASELKGEALFEQYRRYLSDEIESTEEDLTIFHESIFKFEGFRRRLYDAIKVSYHIFESQILNDEIKDLIEKELQSHQRQISSDERLYTGFMKTLDSSIPTEALKSIKAYMLYFSSGIYLFTINLSFFVFSTDMPEYFARMNEELDIADFLKTLSDPTRFKLVSQLAEKEYFGAELAKSLDVTTATISHHIDRIKKLNLLKLRKGEQSKIYYSLSKDMLERYIETLKNQLLGGCK